jgi:ATP-binding cassette subfamily C protein LapB
MLWRADWRWNGDASLSWLRGDILAASLCLNLLALVLPFAILHVYDRVLRQGSLETLFSLAGIVVAAVSMEAAFRVLRSYVQAQAAARFDHRRSCGLFRSMLADGGLEAERLSASEQLNLFRDIQRVKEFRFGPAAAAAIDVPFALVALLLVVSIAGPLALAPVLVLALVLGAIAFVTAQLTEAVETQRRSDRQRFDFLFEVIAGLHTVKAMALDQSLSIRHQRLQRSSASAIERIVLLNGAADAATGFAANLATAAIVAWGAVLALNGQLTIGELAASTTLAGRMLQPIARAASSWTRYQTVRAAERQLAPHFARTDATAPVADAAQAPRLRGHVALEDVSFRWADDQPPVIEGAALATMGGSMIGVTGPSGCGKTTLLRLLAGELVPTSGRLFIDGEPAPVPLTTEIRRRITVISSTGGLFSGTILENVSMFRSGLTEERAIRAISLVGLDAYIATLPRGLDTVIGGADLAALPPSARQLLLIARGLVDDADVILFDDANDGLDIAADRHIMSVLRSLRRRRTVIVASQRPSYLKACDAVFGIENGRVSTLRGFAGGTAAPAASPDSQRKAGAA